MLHLLCMLRVARSKATAAWFIFNASLSRPTASILGGVSKIGTQAIYSLSFYVKAPTPFIWAEL